ncbi:25087_t:CDS:1, partial [Racocetra persica]
EFEDYNFLPQKRGKDKSNTKQTKNSASLTTNGTGNFSESMCFDFQGISNHNDVHCDFQTYTEDVVNQETLEFSEYFDYDNYYSQ